MTTTAHDRWRDSLADEVAFWRSALVHEGALGDAMRTRLKARRAPDWLVALAGNANPVSVLDVGAGPLTTVGTVWEGRIIEVVAVDALADAYDALLDELGITPPVRTIAGDAEHLVDQFGPESFDIVSCGNALDHCADPPNAVMEMVAVARIGVSLRHYYDVADKEHHHGLHQWNLHPLGDNDMAIDGAEGRTLLSELVAGHRIDVRPRPGGDMFDAEIRKGLLAAT